VALAEETQAEQHRCGSGQRQRQRRDHQRRPLRLPLLLAQAQTGAGDHRTGANDGLRGLPVRRRRSQSARHERGRRKADASVLLIGMRMPPNYGRDYADRFAMYGTLSKTDPGAAGAVHAGWRGRQARAVPAGPPAPAGRSASVILANIWPTLQKTIKAK
jgi:acyl-CoA thioesterase-1